MPMFLRIASGMFAACGFGCGTVDGGQGRGRGLGRGRDRGGGGRGVGGMGA